MERGKDLREWYRPAGREISEAPAVCVVLEPAAEEELDIFEEAGLCREEELLFSPWTPEEKKPKKRRWGAWVGGVLGVAAVLGVIVSTSLFFSERTGPVGLPKEKGNTDLYDFYDTFQWKNDADEPTIARAPTNADVQMTLQSDEGLEPLALNDLYAQCLPSVVGIKASQGFGYVWGTGVIMTEDGYILTNAHVLEDACSAGVVLHDETEYEAKLVGLDLISDIAVLKVEASGLPAAQFGDSDAMRVGDEVVAIGNPLNQRFSGTMTEGIISGMSRELTYRGRTMTLMQTSAAINEGNSGGPLFNRYGQVVGLVNMKIITSSSYTPVEGIGFAIPSATVRTTANAILRDGAVIGRPGLGIYGAYVEANTAHGAGVEVATVTEGSDAAAQGLRPGDIILQIDGITVDSFDTLKDRIDSLNVGDTVRLEVWREGRSLEKNVTLIDQNQMDE